MTPDTSFADHILDALSLAFKPISRTVLLRALNEAGSRSATGAKRTASQQAALVKELIARGDIIEINRELTVPVHIFERCARRCERDGSYLTLASALDPYGFDERFVGGRSDPLDVARSLRRALVEGNAQRVTSRLGMLTATSAEPKTDVARWLCNPVNPDELSDMPADLQRLILPLLVRHMWGQLHIEPALTALLERLAPSEPAIGAALARVRLFHGDLAGALQAATFEGAVDPGIAGAVALMRGDLKRAVSLMARAVTAQRESRCGSALALGDIDSLWIPLAYLLQGGTRHGQAVMLTDADFGAMNARGVGRPIYWDLRRLAQLVVGEPVPPTTALEPGAHPAALLLHALVQRWAGEAVDSARLTEAALRCEETGQFWLAGELSVVALGDGSESDDEAWQSCVAEGTRPLALLREPSRAWERQLDAIEQRIASLTQRTVSSGGDERVQWYFAASIKEGWVDLDARVQLRRRGGWSVGKPVARARLLSDPGSVACLSDTDRALIAGLQSEVERYRGRYDEITYLWDWDQTWRTLADATNVVLKHDPSTSVRVTLRKPRLSVQTNTAGLRLILSPQPPNHGGGVVVTELGPGTFDVVDFGGAGAEIARILARSPVIPPRGKDRVGALLSQLAASFEVADSAAVVKVARTLLGATKPIVLLAPHGTGVQARVVVEPLFGSQMKPGEGATSLLLHDGVETVRITRDLPAERAALTTLVHAAPSLQRVDGSESEGSNSEGSNSGGSNSGGWGVVLPDLDQALGLLADLRPLVQAETVEVRWPAGARLRLRSPLRHDKLTMRLRTDGDWFSVTGTLKLAKSAEFEALALDLRALLALTDDHPGRFVALGDGAFAELSDSLRQQLDALRRVGNPEGAGLRLHRLAAEVATPLLDAAGTLRTDAGWKRQLAKREEVVPPLPAALVADLRPYQTDGYRWLARMAAWGAGACLADDMGLGKTLQTLALLLQRAADGPALVVAPTSVCGGWQREAFRFAPTLRVRRLTAGDDVAVLKEVGANDLVIVSYGLLVSQRESLIAIDWSTAVLDEAQAIKNPATRRFKAATALTARQRIALTGTPIENDISELWALMTFLNPGLLGPQDRFLRRFAGPVEAGDRAVAGQLRRLVRPFLLRRTKAAVLDDLPPKIEHTLVVEPELDEAAFYEALRQRAVASLSAQEGGAKPLQILAQLSRLRLACCHPKLALRADESALKAPESAKLLAFGELVEGLLASRQRALVFSQFVRHLDLLCAWLDERQIAYLLLTGSTPAAERDRLVADFQAGQAPLFLISLKAGGTGLNLTAADAVLHMDPWWNPAVEDQATDRAHRIGRTRPVTVYRLVMQGSVEERILALHRTKRDLADRVLAGADAAAQMGTEELMALLR